MSNQSSRKASFLHKIEAAFKRKFVAREKIAPRSVTSPLRISEDTPLAIVSGRRSREGLMEKSSIGNENFHQTTIIKRRPSIYPGESSTIQQYPGCGFPLCSRLRLLKGIVAMETGRGIFIKLSCQIKVRERHRSSTKLRPHLRGNLLHGENCSVTGPLRISEDTRLAIVSGGRSRKA
ncbi:hypothetical protein CEXT_114411 [Caerostris extrusa]|uniref:Uncharacterized protein n=1 Tax=Caerostris extrusa TaxID=172846 RepID=A0AAV4VZF3_CAEEX|nr:hypothetical protein CEXT_114411 [Caerostris extrusa]